jgi:CheY-like chemotaxis protein
MFGKITQYDPQKEIGEVEGEDGLSYAFSLIDAYDFSSTPSIGQDVEFGTEEGLLYYIKPSSRESKEKNNAPEPFEGITPIVHEKTIPVEIELPIPLEISVDESIQKYFAKMIVDLEEYAYDFEEYEQLDYIKMRRFLTTAYHNLLELDPKFVNNDLIVFNDYLDEIYKLYRSFIQKIDMPNVSFEAIFLPAQPQYMWRKRKLETNRGEIITQKGVVKNIALQMEGLKKEHEADPKNAILESKYKRYNGMYVDALHRMASLRDENVILMRELKAFEQTHFGPFVSEFTRFARERKEQILRLLDGYAYYFDKKMWDLAESSKSIREFFRKANVQDEFSSKTYLKYYLKGLDDLKMSELHRELKTLLAYLESLSQVSVAIIDEDKQMRYELLKIIRLHNADVKASAYERFKLFVQRLRQEPYRLVLLDVNVRNPNCEKSIQMIEEIQEKRLQKCRICLMAKHFSKEDLIRYRALGIQFFLLKSLSEKDLARRIQVLLEGLHEDQLRG